MAFQNFGLSRAWLDNCRKSPASEDPSTSNMVNEPKHCWNLNDSTFIIFIDKCEGNWVGKKSLLLICKILRLFVNCQLFSGLLKSIIYLEHFQKTETIIGYVFWKLQTPKIGFI